MDGLHIQSGKRRFDGYCQALREAGIPVDAALVRRGQQDVDTASAAMTELLQTDDPPTAVFSANNRNTIGAIRALAGRMSGARSALPAIVSFDDFELAELMPMPVTVVMHDPRELGRQAARLLFDRLLDNPDASPRELEILALIAQGLRNHDIAARLFLSINSVKSYIRLGYRKIKATSRSEAVLWAVRHDLVRLVGAVPAASPAGNAAPLRDR